MTAEKTVFLFSGQGSQYAGMGVSLVEAHPELMEIFDEASEILGFDLFDKCKNASDEELGKTIVSQPAIMAVSLCACEALKKNGINATAAAGHLFTLLICTPAIAAVIAAAERNAADLLNLFFIIIPPVLITLPPIAKIT